MPGTPKKRAKREARKITDVKAPALPVIDTQTAAQRAAYRLEKEQREWERAAALPKGPMALRGLPGDDEHVREAIMGMTWAGLAPDRIAAALGLSVEALLATYGAEVQHGTDVMIGQVTGRLVMSALTGDTKAAELILKERAGWREKTELTVKGGGNELSDEDRRAMVQKIIDHVDTIKREAEARALPPPIEDAEYTEVEN